MTRTTSTNYRGILEQHWHFIDNLRAMVTPRVNVLKGIVKDLLFLQDGST